MSAGVCWEYLKDAAAELLSMGKLINQGWRFNLSSQNLQATLPSGEIVALDLSDDHILLLPHDNREGDKATQLPDARSIISGMPCVKRLA